MNVRIIHSASSTTDHTATDIADAHRIARAAFHQPTAEITREAGATYKLTVLDGPTAGSVVGRFKLYA
jgi:hypothetical protein